MIDYITISAPCESSLTEKRSEFIAQLFPCKTAEEALAIVETVKGKHHKARHNVWAFALRDGSSRFSDDGEPQGTGGIPVLSVLQKAELTDICCVVTRVTHRNHAVRAHRASRWTSWYTLTCILSIP